MTNKVLNHILVSQYFNYKLFANSIITLADVFAVVCSEKAYQRHYRDELQQRRQETEKDVNNAVEEDEKDDENEKPATDNDLVDNRDKGWRIAIYCDETVPLFGPSLPCPPVFEDANNFREFLLVKLINGEKATFDTPTFSKKRERTLDTLLRDMYQEHTQDSKSNVSKKNLIRIKFFEICNKLRVFDKIKAKKDFKKPKIFKN